MWRRHRAVARFSLDALPAGAVVSQIRRKIYCNTAGGANHLLDDHAYGTNGQDNPNADGAQTCYDRCVSGNLYSNDSSELRTTGEKWLTLGGNVCQDVMDAKSAVNRFSLAWHEEGDDDTYALIDSTSGTYKPQLEITYEEVAPSVIPRRKLLGVGR